MINSRQIKYIHSIRPYYLRKDEDAWRRLIVTFTGDPEKSSLKDLSFDQANQLITYLGGRPFYESNWALFDKDNPRHKYVLSLLIQLGWTRWDVYRKKQIPDLYRFSMWLKSKRSPVRKPLKDMNHSELSKVISALEKMLIKSK